MIIHYGLSVKSNDKAQHHFKRLIFLFHADIQRDLFATKMEILSKSNKP